MRQSGKLLTFPSCEVKAHLPRIEKFFMVKKRLACTIITDE
jgi:hypothetical protein